MFGVSYWLRDGWFVSLYGLEKSSPYELAFGGEIGSKVHFFTLIYARKQKLETDILKLMRWFSASFRAVAISLSSTQSMPNGIVQNIYYD